MEGDYPEPSLFSLFTPESLAKIERAIEEDKEREEQERQREQQEDENEKETGVQHAEQRDEDKPRPDPKLEGGLMLPSRLIRLFPPELYSKPIEDIDPFYRNKYTFVVLGRDNNIYRFSAGKGLFFLSPFSPIRKIAILIITHQLFGLFIIAVIVTNCILMAIRLESRTAEIVFTAIYTVEGILKITARGFILGPFTYLRDPWNWLDFVVVSLAYVDMAMPKLLGNLAALRTVRVLRALKTVAIVPGLKTIVGALMEAVRRLRDVMILTVFVLSIFALVGLQMYQGVLRQKCIQLPEGMSDEEFKEKWPSESKRKIYASNYSLWYNESGIPKLCGDSSSAGQCPLNHTCIKAGQNPDFDFTSFDSFPWAMLCAFRLMTQDYWENLYQMVIRAQGPAHMLFFVLIIFMGSFYLVNLILAIVAMSYDEQQKQDEEEEEEEKEQEESDKNAELPGLAIRNGVITPEDSIGGSVCVLHGDELSVVSRDGSQRRLSVINVGNRENSLSLPCSPVSHRHVSGNRAGHSSLMQRALRSPRSPRSPHRGTSMHARAPPMSFDYNFPYADDSRVVTPTSEDVTPAVSSFATAGATSRHRRRSSSTSHKSMTSQTSLESRYTRRARHGSFTNYYGRMANGTSKTQELIDRGLFRNQEITSIQFTPRNSTRRNLPDVVLNTTRSENGSCTGSDCETNAEARLFPDNPFIRQSPSNTVIDYNDVILLRRLFNQASSRRGSFISNRGLTRREVLTDKVKDVLFGWECCPCWNTFSHYVELFIMDAFVDLFITICIVANTLFMASDYYGMSDDFTKFLADGNKAFTVIFAVEALLKIVALNPINYLKDKWNLFDITIVVLSLVEIFLSSVNGLSILRSFRLLRVFKLARSWPTLNLLIGIVGRTMGALGNLCIVLAIIIFIFAVMGMQLFGAGYEDKGKFPDGPPRWNFINFLHSFMIVFRVLCGEWIESMWSCMHAKGYICVPFFLLTMIIAGLVILNLFLALLLSSFGAETLQPSTEESEPNKLQEAVERIAIFITFIKSKITYCIKKRLRKGRLEMAWDSQSDSSIRLNGFTAHERHPLNNYRATETTETNGGLTRSCRNSTGTSVRSQEYLQGSYSSHSGCSRNSGFSSNSGISSHSGTSGSYGNSYTEESTRRNTPSMDSLTEMYDPEINTVNVVFVRNPDDCCPRCCVKRCTCFRTMAQTRAGRAWWRLRCWMFRLVEHKYFETFIIVMIISSSLALAFEDINYHSKPWLVAIITNMDYFYTVVFVLEMLIKWLAFGFKKYFTDSWCWLDFVIVSISLTSIFLSQFPILDMSALKALRTLRALRPLRAVSRWEGMRVVVNALIGAVPAITNVLLVCIVFWLIFAIMGVNLFIGRFGQCLDENDRRLNRSIVENKLQCEYKQTHEGLNYSWVVHEFNFDNVFKSYLSLLQVATFKGWMPVMDSAVDSRDTVDEQPTYEGRVYMYLYFVCFIIFGSFFTLNLFIGVIIENFNMQKKKSGGSLEMFMSEDQKKYYNAMKKLGSKQPQKPIPKPKLKCQLFFFKVTTNQKFDIGIMIIIVLNMVTMSIEHYGQPDMLTDVLSYVNLVFIAIFTLECTMKLIGLRQYYFKQPWNVFDFIVVILSILGVTFDQYMESFLVSPTLLRVVRVFRVSRVLRLVKSAKGIRTLLFSLAVSLPALFNIGLLLFLVMFIYAIFGMNFFMHVKKNAGIDDMFNFETFGRSIIVLFEICTSASWDSTLSGLINTKDCENCEDKPKSCINNCGKPGLGILYIVTYLVVSFLVVINMYIAVILENFSQATEDVQQGLTQEDFDMYYEVWENFDEKATQYIPLERLSEFVDALEEPLKIANPNYYKLVSLEIIVCEGDKVHCVDILDALTKNFLGTGGDDIADVKTGPKRKDYVPVSTTLRRQRQIVCARILQRAWRNRIRERKAQREAAEAQNTAAAVSGDVIITCDDASDGAGTDCDDVIGGGQACGPLVLVHAPSQESADTMRTVDLGPHSNSVV